MIDPEFLYERVHSLSKSLEGSGYIDEQENPGCYETVLDVMSYLRSKNTWIPAKDRLPIAGSLIVKRWKHNGAVWAGVFSGSSKDSSFDEWLPLPN